MKLNKKILFLMTAVATIILIKSLNDNKVVNANALGDSITEKNFHSEKNYTEYIKENLGLVEYRNYGLSRSTIAKKDINDDKAMCVRYLDMDMEADIITVAGGINDLGWDIPLGIEDSTDERTFYGALNVLCKGLKERYPKGRIIFVTPTKQLGYFKEPNEVNLTLEDYSNAIKVICNKYSIEVYDNNKESGIDPLDKESIEKYTTDGLHWNGNGHEKVGIDFTKYLK